MMAPFIIFHDLRVVLVLLFSKEVFAMGVVIFILRNKMVSKILNIELSLMLVVELLRYLTTYSLLNKTSYPLAVLLFAKCVLSTPGLQQLCRLFHYICRVLK